MTILADMWFLVRWPFYLLARIFHAIYQFSVFLSKPGAALLLAFLFHGIVIMLHYQHKGLPEYTLIQQPQEWYDLTVDWISYDRSDRAGWFFVEIPLLVLALGLQILPWDWLRNLLGLFPAKSRPLPPMRRMRAPKFKVKTVKTKLSIRKRRRYFLRWPYSLKRQLPKEVRGILSK